MRYNWTAKALLRVPNILFMYAWISTRIHWPDFSSRLPNDNLLLEQWGIGCAVTIVMIVIRVTIVTKVVWHEYHPLEPPMVLNITTIWLSSASLKDTSLLGLSGQIGGEAFPFSFPWKRWGHCSLQNDTSSWECHSWTRRCLYNPSYLPFLCPLLASTYQNPSSWTHLEWEQGSFCSLRQLSLPASCLLPSAQSLKHSICLCLLRRHPASGAEPVGSNNVLTS